MACTTVIMEDYSLTHGNIIGRSASVKHKQSTWCSTRIASNSIDLSFYILSFDQHEGMAREAHACQSHLQHKTTFCCGRHLPSVFWPRLLPCIHLSGTLGTHWRFSLPLKSLHTRWTMYLQDRQYICMHLWTVGTLSRVRIINRVSWLPILLMRSLRWIYFCSPTPFAPEILISRD